VPETQNESRRQGRRVKREIETMAELVRVGSSGVIRNAKGQPFSKWKPADKFWHILQTHTVKELSEHVTAEYLFDPERKWRFDFAWPTVMVAVEVQGFGYGHQAQQGIAADNEKANRAVELGWKLFRYDSRLLGSMKGVKDAVDQVCETIFNVETT